MASQTLDIICSDCGIFIPRYQKKGSGQLIKLYLDRVVESDSLSKLKSIFNKSELPTLACSNFGNRIGLAHEGWNYLIIKASFRRKGLHKQAVTITTLQKSAITQTISGIQS
jgi:hypothetical protein